METRRGTVPMAARVAAPARPAGCENAAGGANDEMSHQPDANAAAAVHPQVGAEPGAGQAGVGSDPVGHGGAHGSGHDGHAEEPLGPVDLAAWSAGLLGVAAGLVVVFCFVLATAS